MILAAEGEDGKHVSEGSQAKTVEIEVSPLQQEALAAWKIDLDGGPVDQRDGTWRVVIKVDNAPGVWVQLRRACRSEQGDADQRQQLCRLASQLEMRCHSVGLELISSPAAVKDSVANAQELIRRMLRDFALQGSVEYDDGLPAEGVAMKVYRLQRVFGEESITEGVGREVVGPNWKCNVEQAHDVRIIFSKKGYEDEELFVRCEDRKVQEGVPYRVVLHKERVIRHVTADSVVIARRRAGDGRALIVDYAAWAEHEPIRSMRDLDEAAEGDPPLLTIGGVERTVDGRIAVVDPGSRILTPSEIELRVSSGEGRSLKLVGYLDGRLHRDALNQALERIQEGGEVEAGETSIRVRGDSVERNPIIWLVTEKDKWLLVLNGVSVDLKSEEVSASVIPCHISSVGKGK